MLYVQTVPVTLAYNEHGQSSIYSSKVNEACRWGAIYIICARLDTSKI